MCGCRREVEEAQAFIQQIAESLGVSIKNGEITAEATEADIACKQHMMIQAMLKISDMFLTSSSRVKSLFFEEVDSFFSQYDIRNTPSIMMMGQSGLSHRFDFVIPASKKMPERIVTTLNAPSKQNVQAAIFAWNRCHENALDAQPGLHHPERREKSGEPEIVAAIKSYELVAVPWREREAYIPELAS